MCLTASSSVAEQLYGVYENITLTTSLTLNR